MHQLMDLFSIPEMTLYANINEVRVSSCDVNKSLKL